MKRIPTLFEIALSLALLVIGLYMLYDGIFSVSTFGAAILIAGAFCAMFGIMTLIPALKSILWHWQMTRHSVPHQDLE